LRQRNSLLKSARGSRVADNQLSTLDLWNERLVDYGTETVPDTTMVVNPAHRTLDGQTRKKIGMLNRKITEFGAMNLEGDIEPRKVEAFTQRKSDLQDSITSLQKEVADLKDQRRATKRHIPYKELPPDARFDRLRTQSKHFIDTIKMIAYRAETAMAHIVRQPMTRYDDARSLLRAIYNTEANILPDLQAKTLAVRPARPVVDESNLKPVSGTILRYRRPTGGCHVRSAAPCGYAEPPGGLGDVENSSQGGPFVAVRRRRASPLACRLLLKFGSRKSMLDKIKFCST